jgi:hypothetical protein
LVSNGKATASRCMVVVGPASPFPRNKKSRDRVLDARTYAATREEAMTAFCQHYSTSGDFLI